MYRHRLFDEKLKEHLFEIVQKIVMTGTIYLQYLLRVKGNIFDRNQNKWSYCLKLGAKVFKYEIDGKDNVYNVVHMFCAL